MKLRRICSALLCALLSAVVCAALWPHARDAGAVLVSQHDPARLAEARLDSTLRNNAGIIAKSINAALVKGDADLANSFVELAQEKNVPLPGGMLVRVHNAVSEENSTAHVAKRFGEGLVTGRADDVASLSGTIAGDLSVFGDIRDLLRESTHLVMGEPADRLVLGLAAAGLAVTAATYVSAGGAGPLRAGLTLVKDARKVGRLDKGLAEWAGRSARDIVDTPALERAVESASLIRPARTAHAIRAAFHAEKAGALVRLAKDVGRVTEKAGARGALDTLRIAENPKDVARAARLADAEGGRTRAILKLLGRGALLLAAGAFNLTLWLFGAVLALFGFLSSIKATTERATQAWLDRKKARRVRKQMAAMPAIAVAGLPGRH